MLNNLSFWEKSTYLTGIDFAVIGSGIVGLTAAITFKEKRPKAKVIQRLRERCGDKNLDYQYFGGYELFLADSVEYEKCVQQIPFLNEKLAPIIGNTPIFEKEKNVERFGFGKVRKMIFNRFEGQINPAKMMQRLRFLANELGIQILTGLTIANLEEHENDVALAIESGKPINAAKVLVATNGFTKKLLPNIALQPARNQVLITEPIPNLPLKGTFHFEQGYYYFRNFENRIL